MDNNIYEMMRKYSRELDSMLAEDHENSGIYAKVDGKCYKTASASNLSNLTEAEIEIIDEEHPPICPQEQLLMEDNEFSAIVCSKTPCCMEMIRRGWPLVAALDDMAQIIGYQVQICKDELDQIRAALKNAAGCFVSSPALVITTGRSVYEAMVALTVLEKSAEVSLKAEVLGGVKPLPKIEADLMRMIYKKKYSKSEQEVKSKEGRAENERV